MLGRYQIIRGKRPLESPLPEGHRIDVRAHRKHFLSPKVDAVERLLADPSDAEFGRFARAYRAELDARFASSRKPFDALAASARDEDVYLGCNCPTKRQPDVSRCHTTLALDFMRHKYPKLRVVLPKGHGRGRALV